MPNQPQIIHPEPNTPTIVYKPSELLGIIASYFSQQAADERAKELNASIQKMQQSNGELQKSLAALTAQNTQSTKDLNTAKDHARNLEQQLSELKSKGGGTRLGVLIFAIIFYQ